MQDIKEFTLKELEKAIAEWGFPRFRAAQVFSWIYQKGVLTFDAMSNLPLELRSKLKESFLTASLKLRKLRESSDGTKKLLLELKDANFIESVLIPAKGRVTGCISSQVGCKFCCKFCASGMFGFKRNLSVGEIIEQVLLLKSSAKARALTHLVFMGTGEPFDNYDNTLKAVRIINSPEAFNIGARRITISTSGVVDGIEWLSHEGLQVELSISLHAADDATRDLIMPVNKLYPLGALMKACREYIRKTNRQITFEYILIKNLNSDLKSAANLGKMLKGMNAKVNLIPANPIKELGIAPPGKNDILNFRKAIIKSGVNATLRKPRGEDIEAACGQLRSKYESK